MCRMAVSWECVSVWRWVCTCVCTCVSLCVRARVWERVLPVCVLLCPSLCLPVEAGLPEQKRGVFCANCCPAQNVCAQPRVVPGAAPECPSLEAGGDPHLCRPIAQHPGASHGSTLPALSRNPSPTLSTVPGGHSVFMAEQTGNWTQPVMVLMHTHPTCTAASSKDAPAPAPPPAQPTPAGIPCPLPGR